ncbi:dihydrolipoamide acetyltransferase [Acrocarpospora corrugata]|uniref:Dihydrolipoamide acetyltransferase n=1 Tax=Acrocarpospora corrugata TaxID=35763 RepID=A0A5M3WAC6_9ACTN|nr:alpha/beta hydrolase [Acrocarpospora corrugata]GES04011.1 dihydrolipoamide acetyltransferase [Acrocarpospora corrugata]
MSTVELAYQEQGVPGGVPLFLLHGLTGEPATWDTFIAGLDRHTFALAARGHDRSPRAAEYSIDLMAADALAFIDARGFDVIDMVGHSMGGAIAIRIAQDRPQLIRRLVVEEPPVPPRRPPAIPIESFPEPDEPVDFDWRAVDQIRRGVRAPDPAWWDRLPAITARTLVLSGGETGLVPPAIYAEVAENIPDAKTAVIDIGHCIHGDAPEDFAAVVGPFLDSDAN